MSDARAAWCRRASFVAIRLAHSRRRGSLPASRRRTTLAPHNLIAAK
ncbi:MAG TPA: hypothetical protein PKD53_07670 [Chloroflexaceae bacterium]|nr:hypothetical protein [Chloroflexaceae bacterium]